MDFTYAGLAARPAKRLVRFMAKQDVFDHRISGPLMRGMHHISVDREAGSASFREALTALKNGEIVGVFPEATISRSFELKEFKAGAVRMAAAARVPAAAGRHLGLAAGLDQGPPEADGPHQDADHGARRRADHGAAEGDMAAVTDVLRDRMTTMLHEAQQQYPDKPSDPATRGGCRPPRRRRTDARAGAQLDADERRARRRQPNGRATSGRSALGRSGSSQASQRRSARRARAME